MSAQCRITESAEVGFVLLQMLVNLPAEGTASCA